MNRQNQMTEQNGYRKKKEGLPKRTQVLLAAFLLSASLFTGCGVGTEKTTEGMQLVQKLDYQGALSRFDEAEGAGENMRLVNRGRGIAYMGLTDYPSAVSCFEQALSDSSGIVQNVDFDLNYYLAAAYTKNGQYSEAKSTYDSILALRPEEEDAYFLRGSVSLHLSDYEAAKADFEKVMEMDPKNYDRMIEIYQALASFGYKDAGQEYLRNALAAGETEMAPYDSGRIYYYLEEYQKAYIALEEAKEKGGAESYLYLGKAYEATGDYNYASSVYNSFISQDSTNAEIYNQLGLCELQKKDYQKALEAFQTGMKIEGNEMMQTLSFNEIVAYEYLGEYQKAAVLLQSYLETYPDDEAARRELDFLASR